MASRQPSRSSRNRTAQRDAAAERWLLLLFVVAVLAIAVGLLDSRSFAPRSKRVAPLTMAEARRANAAVPIVARARVSAAPYRFRGGPAERAQAVDCLATAALYEVGDDPRGQRAVIQVILNRARAPGFPRTICGVVYQGFQRSTGCQFSFTCDGSIRRRTRHVGWAAARGVARRALAGRVFADVGRATHYHADWMVPYWRDTMTKVAKVDTHLFYVRR
ncbi:cell wall hydrolase [Sphingomonas sp. 8AM]|uniref:cell wall hydrolase n=1 Tax=Sphingomonas sp. 8AM TaxID=2653170 RepID=UPI001F1FF5E4|nr:cell wall hydrolase [Sphingomonas sp. 8AM]